MAATPPPEEEAGYVHGHAHEPNPLPPPGDGAFVVRLPGGEEQVVAAAALAALPQCEVPGCLIVSTGHGASGPFTFGGVRLAEIALESQRAADLAAEQRSQAELAALQKSLENTQGTP